MAVKYRSRQEVEAYYRDGTPEADSAIIQAVNGAELMTSLGETNLYVPGMLGKHKMPVGWWIYRISSTGWDLRVDAVFRRNYEVPDDRPLYNPQADDGCPQCVAIRSSATA